MAGVVLLAAACGSKEATLKGTVVKDAAPCHDSVPDPASAKPQTPAKLAKPPAKLVTKDLKVDAKGCGISTGTYVGVDYIGVVASTGKTFADSWSSGQPLQFRLGASQVISGWEQGLAGMTVGSRRELTVPAKLAYGAKGLPSLGIGPNAALEFVIDLVSLSDSPTACRPATDIPAAKGKPTTVAMPAKPPAKLVKKDLKVGTGAVAKKGDDITVNYVGISCATGQQFDSSWDRGQPFDTVLSTSGIIAGWVQGVPGMKVGGERELEIPAALGYGAQGQGGIGPNDPLVFVIQLLAVKKPAPATTTTTTTTAPLVAPTSSTTPKTTTTTKK
jgi:peptidylprolyl isomerase